jgi:AAA domain
MKIDPSQELLKTQYSGKTSLNEKPNADEFSAMFKEAIDDDPSKNIEGSKKSQMLNSAAQVQFNTPFAVQNAPLVERTEKFLDLLEEYQNTLMDPRAGLRDVHPLIEKLESEKEALVPLLGSLPEGEGLKEVLNNALVTSSVEVFKFNRGDYV